MTKKRKYPAGHGTWQKGNTREKYQNAHRPPEGARCAECDVLLPRVRWRRIRGLGFFCMPCWAAIWELE